jgi:small-conductance mechanosensitive channel
MDYSEIMRWVPASAIALGIWLLGLLVRRFAIGWLVRLIHRTPTDLDDMLVAAMRPHIPIWFLLLGVVTAVRFTPLSTGSQGTADRYAGLALIASITLATASFLVRFVATRAGRFGDAVPATTLTQNAVRIVVVGLGVLVIVSNLGVSITPVLTALGVGSLAVALALQPTLSNLFAGFHISLARQIRVGDFVELETGQKGYVTDIGWRATQIRELPNNMVVVPNARIAEMIVKNVSLPEDEQSVLVQVGVSYDSDLPKVERVTIEVAREVLSGVQGGVAKFAPFIRYHTFGDSSIDFTVILRVRTYVDRFLVTHEFVKRLQARYASEGIEIPFPQRVVHMQPSGQAS